MLWLILKAEYFGPFFFICMNSYMYKVKLAHREKQCESSLCEGLSLQHHHISLKFGIHLLYRLF